MSVDDLIGKLIDDLLPDRQLHQLLRHAGIVDDFLNLLCSVQHNSNDRPAQTGVRHRPQRKLVSVIDVEIIRQQNGSRKHHRLVTGGGP